MKSHIKSSKLDLFEVWQAMKHAITSQLKELKYVRVSQQVRAPLDISGALYESVRGWVSHQALRKVQEQRLLHLKPHHAPCSHPHFYILAWVTLFSHVEAIRGWGPEPHITSFPSSLALEEGCSSAIANTGTAACH